MILTALKGLFSGATPMSKRVLKAVPDCAESLKVYLGEIDKYKSPFLFVT